MYPLVSILVPCYNASDYLPHCLNSIIQQTYENLQIVLVDDGSIDNTWEILQAYSHKDTRIEVYRQDNQGVATTRNTLLDKVKGNYALFVDADDWIEPDMVDFLVSATIKHDVDIAICANVINDSPVDAQYSETVLSREDCIRLFLLHIDIRGSLWNKLINVSLLHNLRFHCGISYGEDALFCWNVFQNVKKVLLTTRQLYHYRMNENSLCHSTFGPKKFSGHLVWEQICNETSEMWPQYLTIAQARHCIEDTLLLRDATHSRYQDLKVINILQNNIRKLWPTLFKVDITTYRMKLYALFASFSKFLAGIF